MEGLRFHDLRHSAATVALAAGANTRELMERMGHTSPAVALRYQHVMAGRDQAIAAALDELVQAAVKLPTEEASGTNQARQARGSRPPRWWWAPTWGVGGGDDGTRTHDPLLAKQVLFQLSYIPMLTCGFASHHASWTVAQHSNNTITAAQDCVLRLTSCPTSGF